MKQTPKQIALEIVLERLIQAFDCYEADHMPEYKKLSDRGKGKVHIQVNIIEDRLFQIITKALERYEEGKWKT